VQPTFRRPTSRLLVATLAVTVALACAAPAIAKGPTLAEARERTAQLGQQMEQEQQAAADLQKRIVRSSAQLAAEQAQYDDLQRRLIAAREELAKTKATFDAIQARLDDRAVQALSMGGGSSVEVLLESGSFADAVERFEFLDRVQAADAELARKVASAAAALDARQSDLASMLDGQAGLLQRLGAHRSELARLLADQQAHLQALASARQEALDLVGHLERQQARRLAMSGGTAPFGYWSVRFLKSMQAPTCRDNQVVLVAWQVSEYTTAAWNPLATTLEMPGSTVFNSVGVRNYVSLDQGLAAARLTLQRGATTFGYGAVLASLDACNDAMATGQAINASSWCSGCTGGQYVIALIPVVEEYFDRYAGLQA
jgi:peptidoglycan hydrolase CwlO-like protein